MLGNEGRETFRIEYPIQNLKANEKQTLALFEIRLMCPKSLSIGLYPLVYIST